MQGTLIDKHKSNSMTSQTDVKTNEFLRRRKLRLQQVREQSKDIAKKIRERAYDGKLQFITDTDIAKQQEYLKHQNNLIRHLQEYYRKRVDNIGDGHRNACEVDNQEKSLKQLDKSKLRGKEAVAEVRRKKQEKLDEHKKVLDRKLQAREEANEISREKSVITANKLSTRHQPNKNTDKPKKNTVHEENKNISTDDNNDIAKENSPKVTDMSTQWDLDTPTECEPSVPILTLPKEDSASQNPSQLKVCQERNKKIDLFALSDEMPSSLRGGLTNISERTAYSRPSKLVSEYLQNRNLNLRQQEPLPTDAKQVGDLTKLRQTIQRTRSTAASGVCVLDEQLIPMPIWRPAQNCSFCSNDNKSTNAYIPVGNKKLAITNSEFNKIYSSINSNRQSSRNPYLFDKSESPTQVIKYPYSNSLGQSLDHKVGKKHSVTIYNHSTRDTRELQYEDEPLVVRDIPSQEDAYSQASKINSLSQLDDHSKQKEHTSRNKVAVSKLNVEKEYNETIGFLNTLQRNRSPKPVIKNAYKNDKQQKAHTSKQQQKLEYEFNKIESDCRRKHKCQKSSLSHRRSTSRSPIKTTIRDDEEVNDIQYSWMPIPESDSTLAIHTIPTAVKESRVGNNVKFCNIDGYHEYRSRHKHTPPTKDVGLGKQRSNIPKEIYLDDNESSSSVTDSSSNEAIPPPTSGKHKVLPSTTLTDSDHVVIYKLLNQKKHKTERKQKLINDIIKALREEKDKDMLKKSNEDDRLDLKNFVSSNAKQTEPFKQPKEGIYQAVNKNGDSVTNCAVEPMEQTLLTEQDELSGPSRSTSKSNNGLYTPAQWDIESKTERTETKCIACQCEQCQPKPQKSVCTSASSFQTATQVIAHDINMLNDRFTKLIEDSEKESQKLYVGATGLLKDDAYEVVIHLKKKESSNTQKDNLENIDEKKTNSGELNIEKNGAKEAPPITNEKNQESNETNDVKLPEQIIDENIIPEQNTINGLVVDSGACELSCSTNIPNQEVLHTNSPVDNEDAALAKKHLEKPCDLKTVCTQTSYSSPNPQSAVNQMSSSASTSYMSPPESVLPRYLRNKYCAGDQECQHGTEVEESPDSFEHKNSACRKCRHKRKVLKVHSENQTKRNPETPPPALRSIVSEEGVHDSKGVYSHDIKHKRNQCRKKRNLKVAKVYVNSYLPSNKKSKDLKFNKVRESGAASMNINEQMSNNIDLNPVVKTYVNKLLSLNKESLKAIDVVKQDCSSISTPGSSVIDLPNNFQRSHNKAQKKISLEQIKTDIVRQLVNAISDNAVEDLDTLHKNATNSKNSTIKTSKKKQVHKVKSLKLTKKLVKKSSKIKGSSKESIKSALPKRTFDNSNIVCYNMKTAKPNNRTKEPAPKQIRNKTHPQDMKGDNKYINKHFTSVASSCTALSPAVKHYDNMTDAPKECKSTIPVHISTQTSSEISFIKLAESKLQNMEKIADLTEKCTEKLSNLAKVLDEVRKNKSAAYTQISTPDLNSDCEQKSIDKDMETLGLGDIISPTDTHTKATHDLFPIIETNYEGSKSSHYIPFINDISNSQSESSEHNSVPNNHAAFNVEQIISKHKSKPPPVLVRSKSKDKQEVNVPHELSTVIEVDSPISAKLKIQPYNDKLDCQDKLSGNNFNNENNLLFEDKTNPDILQNDINIHKVLEKSANSLSDNSKAQMIDLNQFNKIMLQPFISINDYAKDYRIHSMEEASNIEEVVKNDAIADDISSLHSEGSLPDVVSELLKRNIIAEPFKFDSGNSTTISSDTTLSMLAMNKHKKEPRKVIRFENKENLGDTSDTLSISSNPDLEHAFKKIGLGWASSTLKKTKERLALSSSSNTSSSSISHFKIKTNKDFPALVTDSLTSATKDSKKKSLEKPKTAEQQTSFYNSMTVKDFLTNELAKRITFASTSNRSERDEFISLQETKMPEEMKQSLPDHSSDQSQNNGNRARTSTPVQLFKSMTYRSSTNSNTSNGLFSNVDELSSVKGSLRNHSTSDQDNLTIPNLSLKTKKNSDCSKSE